MVRCRNWSGRFSGNPSATRWLFFRDWNFDHPRASSLFLHFHTAAVNLSSLRSTLLAVALAITPAFLNAADPTPVAPAATPARQEVIELPKIQVTTQRAKSIDKEIKRLDKLIARERKKIKSTDLDKALNNDKVARAAAIFGGNSADHMSAVAASRVMLLEQERDVLEAMKRPATLEELDLFEAQIQELRTTRRNLDDAAKQR
jgi:hypothetical protein